MSRNPDYEFIPTDAEEIVSLLTEAYEEITKTTVHPASPERLFIQWASGIIIHERVLNNYTGNQNIPSRAAGKNLDALAELVLEQERPGAKAAVCTMRFYISVPQEFAVLIPAGTRVTDEKVQLVWETGADAYVDVGESFADVRVRCQSTGTVGNGYEIGQIDTLVDIYDYYSKCENITASEGGADAATDQEFYEIMRASMDGYSCAGSLGGYAYFAKRVSTEIADVVPNSPTPGVVYIYVLMDDGNPAGEEMKKTVFEACSGEKVRAFTDHVHMGDPEAVPYNIDFTYYVPRDTAISSAEIQKAVEQAAAEFVKWQCGKLGRDINPSKLYHMLMETGVKRVDMREPSFVELRDGKLPLLLDPDAPGHEYSKTVPQIAKIQDIHILNGGYEDE